MNRNSNHIVRRFLPADQWLFIKIYCGESFGDYMLIDNIYPLIKYLKKKRLISKWFYIRYSDPDFHLRVRMELSDNSNAIIVLNCFNAKLSHLFQNRLIYNIVIDSYNREIERYGINSMELTESIFDIDSNCICTMLKPLLEKNEGVKRWELGVIWINAILDVIVAGTNQKWEIVKAMSKGYLNEFGFNEHNIKILAERYRLLRSRIMELMNCTDNEILPIVYSFKQMLSCLLLNQNNTKLNIPSLIHMSMNRLFICNSRINELVLYYCLEKYYCSQIKKC